MTSTHRNGTFYPDTKSVPVKEITATIRATVRSLVKQGMIPSDWKYSVQYKTASQYEAIEITVSAPREVFELKHKFEEQLWSEGKNPIAELYGELCVGEFELVGKYVTTILMLEALHKDFNFYERPENPLEDGCSFRYGGRVTFAYLD